MRIFVWYVLVLSSMDVALKANAKTRQKENLVDDPLGTYNEVVRNLIRNWESPVVYLRDRGFLPKNFEDTSKIKPNLDALMQRIERAKRQQTKGKDIMLKIRPKEMVEIKQLKKSARNQRGIFSKSKQLKIRNSKLSKSKAELKEQEEQLLAMKRRLEELQPSGASPDQLGYRRQINLTPSFNDPVKSPQSYDEILQRMIERTSPLSKHHSSFPLQTLKNGFLSVPVANTNFCKAQLGSKEDNLVPSSLSTYKAFSFLPNSIDKLSIDLIKSSRAENKSQASAPKLESNLEAPRYLNWDMKKGQLDPYSSVEKEAYLNQLVKVFGKNYDSKETYQKRG
ncbi:uncharacterized protein LOC108053343 [Drosophila rhopaloa]|uniref:Uncharacterized protein LOC108053343 n=1 Tax=Drosophila rhopaloa TaxID=1041015 RepID=A0A6P4FV92_DRORH|nr:uncharacterized protein LOC108053343 [Drosophila rhopaloa]